MFYQSFKNKKKGNSIFVLRKEYSNDFQIRIVIVGQVHILAF